MTVAGGIETAPPKYPSPLVAWWSVTVLFLVYTVSFVDRVLIGLLVEPIKADLALTDTQFALLQGLAFAILYTVLGLPFGWLADRFSRKRMIAAASAVWCLSTSACGLAGSFGQLLAARLGVGAGEAALSPAAISLIADSFPPDRRALPMSVYTAASSFGAGLALLTGSAVIGLVATAPTVELPAIGIMASWQAVFVLVGLGGLAVTLLTLCVREPARAGAATPLPRHGGLWSHVRRHARLFAPLFGAVMIYTAMAYGLLAWVPAFFIRTYGMTPAAVGTQYGTVLLVCGGLGGIVGAKLSHAIPARFGSPGLIVSAASAMLVGPLFVIAFTRDSAAWALGWLAPALLVYTAPGGLAITALQAAVPAQERGMAAAVYYLAIGLFGMTFGPLLIASLSDGVFGSSEVGTSLAVAAGGLSPIAAVLLWLAAKEHQDVVAATADGA